MNLKTLRQVGQLYEECARSHDADARRRSFAALSELLSAYLAAEERALKGRISLSLVEFRTIYVAARTFSEVRKLEVGSPAFDARLRALCVQLGAIQGDGVKRAA